MSQGLFGKGGPKPASQGLFGKQQGKGKLAIWPHIKTFLTSPRKDKKMKASTYKVVASLAAYEPRCEKTGLRDFRPGQTQTGLCSHRRWLEAGNFVFRK